MDEKPRLFVDPRGDLERHFRVLLVDDEEDILAAIKTFVQASMKRVDVVTAKSGPEGLEILRRGGVDLIVSDYKMPGMNGLEFLEKAYALAPRTPRVMLTAFPDLDLAMKAINEERIRKFLTKPVDPKRLVLVIQEILDELRAAEVRHEVLDRTFGVRIP